MAVMRNGANDYYLLMAALLQYIFPPSKMLQTKSWEMMGEKGRREQGDSRSVGSHIS